MHQVNVAFCECGTPVGGYYFGIQLLRSSLFPTTIAQPRTAFTFEVLELFHHQTLQGKTTAWDFYNAIMHVTDNVGINPPPVRTCCLSVDHLADNKPQRRYNEFLQVMRWWRHLKMCKRAGRGHDPDGPASTSAGGLAIECPACPHPGRNLPVWWDTEPRDTRSVLFYFLSYCFVLTLMVKLALHTVPCNGRQLPT